MSRLVLLPWAMFVLIMRNPSFFFLCEEQEPILEVGHHNQSAILNKWVIHHFSNVLYSVFLQFNSSMCSKLPPPTALSYMTACQQRTQSIYRLTICNRGDTDQSACHGLGLEHVSNIIVPTIIMPTSWPWQQGQRRFSESSSIPASIKVEMCCNWKDKPPLTERHSQKHLFSF